MVRSIECRENVALYVNNTSPTAPQLSVSTSTKNKKKVYSLATPFIKVNSSLCTLIDIDIRNTLQNSF